MLMEKNRKYKRQKPSERYFHSMNYYELGNFLIIHGGRNDSKSESFSLDDTYNSDLYQWLQVNLVSNIPNFEVIARCAHYGVIYSDKFNYFWWNE